MSNQFSYVLSLLTLSFAFSILPACANSVESAQTESQAAGPIAENSAKGSRPVLSLPFFLPQDHDEKHCSIPDNLRTAFVNQKNGNYEEAIALYKHVLDKDPGNVQAANNLAVCFKQLGLLDEAIGEYKKLLVQHPNKAELITNLGSAYAKKGDLNKSFDCYYQAILLKPSYAPAHFNLAHAYTRMSNLDNAIEEHTKAIALDPNNANYHRDFAACLNRLRFTAQAEAEYERAVKLNDISAETLVALANVKIKLGKAEEARNLFQKVLQTSPDDSEALAGLAHCYLLEHKLDLAQDKVNESLDISAECFAARAVQAQIYYEKGEFLNAVNAWKQITRIVKVYPEAHYKVGLCLEKLNLKTQAYEALERALKQEKQESRPDIALEVDIYRALSRVSISLNKQKEAAIYSKEAKLLSAKPIN